jgi:hypothetical protein
MGLRTGRGVLLSLTLLGVAAVSGCASVPYEYGHGIEVAETLKLRPGEEQVERGRPMGFLDWVGHHIISLPSKLILWNWDVDRHSISPETEAALRRYLAENELGNVKIRLNEYSPGDEFRRLFHNKAVGGFWRYTIGVLSVVFYTVLPGRLLGGDNYNPFTNTLNLYSDHPAIALHEAGHAKDFAETKWKGTYATLRILPIVPLVQEGAATGDAIGYYKDKDDREGEKDAYKILYPAFGTYIGGEVAPFYTGRFGYLLSAAFAIPGHIVGRIKAAHVDDPVEAAPVQDPSGWTPAWAGGR